MTARGVSQDEFQELLREWIKRMCSGQKSAAKHLKVSEQYLSDVLNGKRAPGKKLLQSLHMKREVRYTGGLAT